VSELKNENNERHHAAIDKLLARIAELEAENEDLRRDDEMLRRALSNMGRWAVDDILDRYPVTKRKGCEGPS
jgi:predicted RNase H-like nuclease (RuvC/YqgF family)